MIINFLREQSLAKLTGSYLRSSYAADRYFQFTAIEELIRSNSLLVIKIGLRLALRLSQR